MKLKIKIRVQKDGFMPFINPDGEWIDIRLTKDLEMKAPQAGTLKRKTVDGNEISYRNVKFDTRLIDLGLSMELPKGFEAHLLPRSSTPNRGVIVTNSEGIIDNTYRGEKDIWKLWVTALDDTILYRNDRICQFRIQLSQKATVWQKLKWLFSSGIELVQVNELSNNNRGGIGSSGK